MKNKIVIAIVIIAFAIIAYTLYSSSTNDSIIGTWATSAGLISAQDVQNDAGTAYLQFSPDGSYKMWAEYPGFPSSPASEGKWTKIADNKYRLSLSGGSIFIYDSTTGLLNGYHKEGIIDQIGYWFSHNIKTESPISEPIVGKWNIVGIQGSNFGIAGATAEQMLGSTITVNADNTVKNGDIFVVGHWYKTDSDTYVFTPEKDSVGSLLGSANMSIQDGRLWFQWSSNPLQKATLVYTRG